MKPSSVTIPTRECRSNSEKTPRLNASITSGSIGSGKTTYPLDPWHLGFRKVFYLDFAADVLCVPSPFQFNDLDTKFPRVHTPEHRDPCPRAFAWTMVPA